MWQACVALLLALPCVLGQHQQHHQQQRPPSHNQVIEDFERARVAAGEVWREWGEHPVFHRAALPAWSYERVGPADETQAIGHQVTLPRSSSHHYHHHYHHHHHHQQQQHHHGLALLAYGFDLI